jgi:hypothetical protein
VRTPKRRYRAARDARLDVLAGVLGARLTVVVRGREPLPSVRALIDRFAPGPVVVGPSVGDLASAARSAQAAAEGLRVCSAWPDAPRPVLAEALLPERALAGDRTARLQLVEDVYLPLRAADSQLLETLTSVWNRPPPRRAPLGSSSSTRTRSATG